MSGEVNYKKDFCHKYFDKNCWDLDVLNKVDILLKDQKNIPMLYIESKPEINNTTEFRKALAQIILTNKKQEHILNKVALIYRDIQGNDVFDLVDCSENEVMYNNDINWKAEVSSKPTRDAIDRINDRLKGKVTHYVNEEIKEIYKRLKKGLSNSFDITEKNVLVVYNQWKNNIKFKEKVEDEQELINLFFIDILNNTSYKDAAYETIESKLLLLDKNFIREGTNLSRYQIMKNGAIVDGIKYSGKSRSAYYTFDDPERYNEFWKKYKRPPELNEFWKILEHSAKLYTEKYRKSTGGEYTPSCFVEKQNEILMQHYNLNDFIVFDPCAGVGNLQNQFGSDFKEFCYLSTLEQMDVDICKNKMFDNVIQFDYLKDATQPKWKYKGKLRNIKEICALERKRLMVIMNPPYKKKRGVKYNLAIEFFNKVVTLEPDVIVFYYSMESFFKPERLNYINSGYKIVSHIFSNAKTTFQLSEWPISLVIFDKENGQEWIDKCIKADRYELNKKTEKLEYIKTYCYDNTRPYLIDNINDHIKKNMTGLVLGQWSFLNYVIMIGNGGKEKRSKITTNNLAYSLLSTGINFNTHAKYFERNNYCCKGTIEKIPVELYNDAILFSLFYINNMFSNKGCKNYVMPFNADDLGCIKNDLNVLFPDDYSKDLFSEQPFDFRQFLSQFEFSKEAKDLFKASLEVFKYYHRNGDYQDKDWNDSFYDITNAIMGKDANSFKSLNKKHDKRISQVKTTKGTRGFSRKTIKYVVNSQYLDIFENFFDARDILAKKINTQLVDNGLLLWQRENIY